MTDYVPWTDAELDELARVTAEEIEQAKEAFRLNADRKYKLLLDAQPYEPEQLPLGEGENEPA